VLALVAVEDLEVEQIDFIGTFLNLELDTEVYLEIPEGLYEYSLSSTTVVNLLKQYG